MNDALPVGIIAGGWPALVKRVENTLLIGVPLAGSVWAVAHGFCHGVRWSDIAAFLLFYGWSGFGVALGFHRLFSHHSFRPHPVISAFLCAGGTMAFQGSAWRWTLDHRRHHALTDRAGDVHSPHVLPDGTAISGLRGFLHAHTGWMFDRWTTDPAIFGKGLGEDRIVIAFTRTHWLWLGASLGLPYGFGWLVAGHEAAFSAMLFGGCLRTTVLHHVVWSVNSFGHMRGQRNHPTRDESRDNWWLAVLTFGDGWHNGHHRADRSHRHGNAPGQRDANAAIIRLLQRIGLADSVVPAPRSTKGGEDSHVR